MRVYYCKKQPTVSQGALLSVHSHQQQVSILVGNSTPLIFCLFVCCPGSCGSRAVQPLCELWVQSVLLRTHLLGSAEITPVKLDNTGGLVPWGQRVFQGAESVFLHLLGAVYVSQPCRVVFRLQIFTYCVIFTPNYSICFLYCCAWCFYNSDSHVHGCT